MRPMSNAVTAIRGFDVDAARAHLARRDRKLARWLERIAPIAPDPGWLESFDPVDALARAILYQQLSGRAAATAQASRAAISRTAGSSMHRMAVP